MRIFKILIFNLIVVVSINIFFFTNPFTIDITHDKRYTLSNTSKEIINNLDGNIITINLFLDTDLTPNFRRLLIATKDLLNQYKSISKNKILLNFIDPFKNKSISDQEKLANFLSSKGIDIINISTTEDGQKKQKLIIPGAIISQGDRNVSLNLLYNNNNLITQNQEEIIDKSIENLEYAFSIALKQVSIKNKPLIGFTFGHGELNDQQLKDITFSLSKLYNVLRVDLTKIKLSDLLKFKSIIIAKPLKSFSELEKYKLDQFLMHNNGIILLTSQNNASDKLLMDSNGKLLSTQLDLNLDDLLFKYGIKINYNIVQDIVCSPISVITGSQSQNDLQQVLPWVYYPLLTPNNNHILTKKLGSIKSEYISTIDILKNRPSKKNILLTTSKFNREANLPAFISLDAVAQKPKEGDFNSTPKIAAVLLEGKFNSVFNHRNNIFYGNKYLDKDFLGYSKNAKLVVVSDGNIIKNDTASDNSIYPLGFDKYSQITYSNKVFVTNIVNYVSGNEQLVQLRAKTIIPPILNTKKADSEQTKWKLINVMIPIGLIFLFYITIISLRKLKINNRNVL